MRKVVGALVGLAVTMYLNGCGPSTSAPAPSASTTTLHAPSVAPSSVDDALAARNHAIAAYRGMWAAYQKAGENADPDYPDLRTYATGDALDTLTSGLASIRDRGLVAKGEIVLSPKVTGFEPADKPTSIDITDCADTSSTSLSKRSGEPYVDTPGGRRLILANVRDTGGGTWKVVSFGVRDVGTC